MSAAGRLAPGDSLHVDRVGVFINLCKVIIHQQPKAMVLGPPPNAFESRMDIFGEMPDFSFTRSLRACRVTPRHVLGSRSLRKGLEIKASLHQSIFSRLAVLLLGLIRRVVTNRPVDLFNKLSPCSIQYSANWFPRKCAVILFCCDSDNVPFVLFFHKHIFAFSRFKLYRDWHCGSV